MRVLTFDCIESTHLYLANALKEKALIAPIMVVANQQSKGIGSRGNVWKNVLSGLYCSFAIPFSALPKDLPLESASIYMGFILKEILNQKGAHTWLKWPNDLYVRDKKVGGVLCMKIETTLLVGIGINLKVEGEEFGALDIEVSRDSIIASLLETLTEMLENSTKSFSWKQIFSKYALEFSKQDFHHHFHHQGRLVSMRDAVLCDDGAILVGNERIYSLR